VVCLLGTGYKVGVALKRVDLLLLGDVPQAHSSIL
jgi:hypothetical protein